MCLIDPQAHMYVQLEPLKFKSSNPFTTLLRTAPHNECTIYWDGGAKKIAAWKQQHLQLEALPSSSGKECALDGLCSENWICTTLELSTLEMEDLDDESGSRHSPPSPSPRKPARGRIDYIVNWTTSSSTLASETCATGSIIVLEM